MVLRKFEIEEALREENQEISAGRLKEENPLDLSEDFRILCIAARRGDLKTCHEKITAGVNINARDLFDYTPLILVLHPSLSMSIAREQESLVAENVDYPIC